MALCSRKGGENTACARTDLLKDMLGCIPHANFSKFSLVSGFARNQNNLLFTTQIGENAPVQNQGLWLPARSHHVQPGVIWKRPGDNPRRPTRCCEDNQKKTQELRRDQGIHRFVRRLGRRCKGRRPEPGSTPPPPAPFPPQPLHRRLPSLKMPPNDFSNHLARWVYKHHCSAVVYLEFRPDPNLVLQRWNTVYPVNQVGRAAQEIEEKRGEESEKTYCCTGFFVATSIPDPNGLFVLTSAHVLHPVFSANMPITVDQANVLYQPWLLCGHQEEQYLGLEGPIQRDLTRGEVYAISCENDLMLLRFTVAQMDTFCSDNHRLLAVASEFPTTLKEMELISWPGVGRRWASALGTSSQEDRRIDDLGEDNSFGFTTRLSEVDITSEGGCSGAPLLNSAGHVLGVLHGGNKAFSYFVGFRELRNTAIAWGIIVQ